MRFVRAHLVVSEAGMNDLCCAGITTGWLSAWLQSAGARRVDLHLLESDTWKQAVDWQIFYASESELMRVALYHGKRIRAREDGGRTLLGADSFQLENPCRIAWHYTRDDGSCCVLLPLGDISYQRERWLHILNAGGPLLPLHVYPGDHGGIALEPGLHGLLRANPGEPEDSMNDGGYLPEETLSYKLKSCGLKVRFAESCTGGGLSERLSRLPGSSEVLDAAWITYSNDAKHALLKIPKRLITKYGAVSREVVEAMAHAGCNKSHACVAVSGIAGPDGGSEDKPVGTVWMAAALPDGTCHTRCERFPGSRAEVRQQIVNYAFALLAGML
ncbi:MAG: CinA family protein [Mariprofundaceae bacterium]|nr:CinA family protein [Mariprofundaceae bacterium]